MIRAIAALALTATAAQAGPQCAMHDDVAGWLKKDFGETPQTIAMSSQGNMVKTFAAPGGKTWTVVVTRPDGISCLVSGGTDYKSVPQGDPA